MKTKQNSNKADTIKIILCAALTLTLICLTLLLIYMLNFSQIQVPFDLDSITAEKDGYSFDITKYFLPEFIGFTSDDEKLGISGSLNIMSELYKEVSPVISELLGEKNASSGTAADWERLENEEISFYIRYHSELPDCVIGIFADEYSDISKNRNTVTSYVYEMLLIPNTDGSGMITLATKSRAGEVEVYCATISSVFTGDSISKMLESYNSYMYSYVIMNGEPVFTETVVTRNIIMTGSTAMFIQNNSDAEIKQLMRFFDLNPDKLLSSHVDEDGNGSYIDTHGILYITESCFEYSSTSDGGIGISDFIGKNESGSIKDYIEASISIISFLRSMNKNYTGGDAEIYLDSVTSSGGIVTLTFMYAFDNIRITDISPAFTAVFEGDIVRSAKLYTMSVRNLGDRQEMISESSFLHFIGTDSEKNSGTNQTCSTGLVYRGNFLSESVKSEWRHAVYADNKEN